MEDFSSRADTVFNLEKQQKTQAAPAARTMVPPDINPDMAKLVGRAENFIRFRDD